MVLSPQLTGPWDQARLAEARQPSFGARAAISPFASDLANQNNDPSRQRRNRIQWKPGHAGSSTGSSRSHAQTSLPPNHHSRADGQTQQKTEDLEAHLASQANECVYHVFRLVSHSIEKPSSSRGRRLTGCRLDLLRRFDHGRAPADRGIGAHLSAIHAHIACVRINLHGLVLDRDGPG
jgi:hypothetical protein